MERITPTRTMYQAILTGVRENVETSVDTAGAFIERVDNEDGFMNVTINVTFQNGTMTAKDVGVDPSFDEFREAARTFLRNN